MERLNVTRLDSLMDQRLSCWLPVLAGKAAPIAGWSNHLWTGEPDPATRTTHVVSVGPGGGFQVWP